MDGSMGPAVSPFSCEAWKLPILPSVDRPLSVSCDLVNGGKHRTAGPWSGIRTAINVRLEEVSFRKGVIAGAITLVTLAAATAVVMITAMPSSGIPVNSAAETPAAASSPVAAVVPIVASSARTPGHSLRTATSPASTPAAGAYSAVQTSQSSPNPNSNQQYYGSGDGSFGDGASWQDTSGSHWADGGTGAGSQRHGRTDGNFTRGQYYGGAQWRSVP